MGQLQVFALFVLCISPFSRAIPFSGLRNASEIDSSRQIVHPNRIVGGVAADKGEFPFIVSVRFVWGNGKGYMCGGAILDEYWVLTAAHCSQELASDYRLVAGAYDFRNPSDDEQSRDVEKVIYHENYDPGTTANDVGLMKVTVPFDLSTSSVKPIELAAIDAEPPQTATVTGWGTLHSGDTSLPSILQKVDVPFVPDADCEEDYENINPILPSMVCYGEAGKDSCQGDSGGPLFSSVDNVVYEYGIVSWGVGCAERRYPGVYSKIPYLRGWILDTMENN